MNERRDPGPVVVTGAAGRLGAHVVATLTSRGHQVVATDRRRPSTPPNSVPFVEVDLRDHQAVTRLVAGARDVVHLGNHPGIGSRPPQEVFAENVTMNVNVFQAAAEQDLERVVFASTVQLIGSHRDDRTVRNPSRMPDFPIDGSTAPDPANLYALSKSVSESMLRYFADRCGLDVTLLRFPLLHAHEPRFQIETGQETATSTIEGFSALSYVDAAGAIAAVLETALPGYRIYVPALSHRHRDLTHDELVRRFYPDHNPSAPLVDFTELTQDTGWRPSDSYHPGAPTAPADPREQEQR